MAVHPALGAVSVDAPYLPWREAEAQQLGAVRRVRVERKQLRLAPFGIIICGCFIPFAFPFLAFRRGGAVGQGVGCFAAARSGIMYHGHGRNYDDQHGQEGAPVVALQVEKGVHLCTVVRFYVFGFYGYWVIRSYGCRVLRLCGLSLKGIVFNSFNFYNFFYFRWI